VPAVEGKVLWLAHHPIPRGVYTLKKVDLQPNGRYHVRITVGGADDAGYSFEIRVFYLDESDSQFLEGVMARSKKDDRPGSGYSVYKALPPRRDREVGETVQRRAIPKDATC
jgi:hypothetical protein